MSDPSGSKAYRNPTVEEDDDDLDDLDDVLASFNKPAAAAQPAAGSSTDQPSPSIPRLDHAGNTAAPAQGEEDFEASLVEGMESLLRQLAGDHPPGPSGSGPVGGVPGDVSKLPGGAAGSKALSPEEEEAAWQKALELMLSGEGLSALGVDGTGAGATAGAAALPPAGTNSSAASTSGPAPPPRPAGAPDQASFEETIRRTMESLKTGGEGSRTGAGMGGNPPDLAKLLEQLGSDPSLLEGLGEGGDDDLGGLLDGMMSQLMTKEVLEEPMAELASKYPAYLASPPKDLPPASLEKYKQQHALVTQIVELFRKPGFSDERDGKEVARLVGEMQDLGGPPEEVLGEMPEGFDMAKMLGGDGEEGCVIM